MFLSGIESKKIYTEFMKKGTLIVDVNIRKKISYTKHTTLRWSVNPKNDSSLQINLICVTKDEEMVRKNCSSKN